MGPIGGGGGGLAATSAVVFRVFTVDVGVDAVTDLFSASASALMRKVSSTGLDLRRGSVSLSLWMLETVQVKWEWPLGVNVLRESTSSLLQVLKKMPAIWEFSVPSSLFAASGYDVVCWALSPCPTGSFRLLESR